MQNHRILIVDDDVSLRTALYRTLDRKGYKVISAANKSEALGLVQNYTDIKLALIDLRLPDGDGIELMTQLKKQNSQMKAIILTGFGTIDLAVKATQSGAYHFVTKPFNLDEILNLIEKAFVQSDLEQENSKLKNELQKKYQFDNIVGQSDEIIKVLNLVDKVSDSDATVLITGESGTGKELIARALHFNSARAQNNFVPLNCGAIPGELLESELFGHVKGAFTGAIANRSGRFEAANKGTLFLDEIGDMSHTLQVKLLRVLQERKFEPVGSNKSFDANVRVIAATNKDLEKSVEQGVFREDLFYRLNVIPIHIPPLRERRSDIPLLLNHFREYFNQSRNRSIQGYSPEVLDVLFHYDWPGNIRELENLVERLTIIKSQGVIEITDLPEKYQGRRISLNPDRIEIPETGMDFNSAVNSYENSLILKALEKTGWNRNQAALLLKLNRTTLVEKIKKKGL
ncbi:MAG: sigma-54-dependent Fis family transcriptional regulator, partial [Bdellovibrionales bacterium]|nr:sigma-54-dependent Fis family transcriptional regulator [Bdellovibrionales bacterium]